MGRISSGPLWSYADFYKFEFGKQKPSINSTGKETTTAD